MKIKLMIWRVVPRTYCESSVPLPDILACASSMISMFPDSDGSQMQCQSFTLPEDQGTKALTFNALRWCHGRADSNRIMIPQVLRRIGHAGPAHLQLQQQLQ